VLVLVWKLETDSETRVASSFADGEQGRTTTHAMPDEERYLRKRRHQQRRWAKARAAGDLSSLPSTDQVRALVQARLTPDNQLRFASCCAALAAETLGALDETLTAISTTMEQALPKWDTEADQSMERVSKRFLADLEGLQQVRGARKLSQLSIWNRISRAMAYAERRARQLLRCWEHDRETQSNPFVRQVTKLTRGTSFDQVYRRAIAREHLEELADAAAQDDVGAVEKRRLLQTLRRPESRFQLLLAKLALGSELCSPELQSTMLAMDLASSEQDHEETQRTVARRDEQTLDKSDDQLDGRSTSSTSSSSSGNRAATPSENVDASQKRQQRRHFRRKRSRKEDTTS
jgi:hypothetical protein